MTIGHLQSPRADFPNNMYEIAAQIENTDYKLMNLVISSCINSNPQSQLHPAVIMDLVQTQLRCIQVHKQNEVHDIERLKTVCTKEIKRLGKLHWQKLSLLVENLQISKDDFFKNWQQKTFSYLPLKLVENEENLNLCEEKLYKKLTKLQDFDSQQENLYFEEAEIEVEYNRLLEEKAHLQQSLNVNNVFQAAQLGDVAFLHNHSPKPFLGLGKKNKIQSYVDQKDSSGFPLLHFAAYSGRLEVVKFLIQNKATVEIKDKYGDTPLHWASASGAYEVAHYLLLNGASPNAKGKREMIPLHRSVFKNHYDVTKLLLNKGADVNAIELDDDGSPSATSLIYALVDNNLPMVNFLLNNASLEVGEKEWKIAKTGDPKILHLLQRHFGQEEGIPRISIDDITEKQKLAEGSYGAVYRGKWQGEEIAFKMFHYQPNPDELVEMNSEAALMENLQHPNIIKLVGLLFDRAGFVMELASKGSLYGIIPTEVRNTWAWPQLLGFGKQMATGLSYLHNNRILHRDFKSLNVLVNGENQAIITDLGASRLRDRTGLIFSLAGSPAWMAPEQITTNSYGFPADVFSLGMVLWEIFEAKRPFEKYENIAQIWHRVTCIKPGEDVNPFIVPGKLVNLLKSCWQDPKLRPTAGKVLEELEAVEETDLQQFKRPHEKQ